MNDKLIGKAQALKELLESGNLRDDCVVYLPEWPVSDPTGEKDRWVHPHNDPDFICKENDDDV